MKDDGPGESVDDLRRQFEGLLELVARYQQKDHAMLERERTVSAAEAMVRDRLAALVPREAELARREALVMSFADVFLVLTFVIGLLILLVAFMERPLPPARRR